MVSVIEAVEDATRELAADSLAPSSRFAFEVPLTRDPVSLAGDISQVLGPLAQQVGPLSSLEPRIIVAELDGRAFVSDDAAFAAAYALAEEFELPAVEPDLVTSYFPEGPSTDSKDPRDEGASGFPPGCWVPARPELDDDPRWALDAMRVPEAWELSTAQRRPSRGEGIVIAQPDTGVTLHAELDGVVRAGGTDIVDGGADPTDPLDGGGNPGHGTATASVVVSPRSLVITGSAPRASHMPIRAIRSVVRVGQVSVAQAIDWAVEHGAHVITMSLGGIPSFSLHRALRRAVAADVIVLAAAGNCVRFVVWPARYDDCIAVAGTNWQHRPWRGSCRGAAVDISAPGENVLRARTVPGQAPSAAHVGQGQGTSFAVALTAGAAALWLAHHGRANLVAAARARSETLQEMFRRLVRATASRPAGWDAFSMGAGVVDAYALLTADLDLRRDRETVAPAADPRARAAVSIESLIAEAVSVEAASNEDLDWHRFGPEVGNAVLKHELDRVAMGPRLTTEGGPQPETPAAPPRPPTISYRLAETIPNPDLRDWLHLDDEPVPEVGREEPTS